MTRPNEEFQNKEDGFTLLEILVVIAILGLLIGLVAPAALRQLSGAKTNITRQSIQRIGSVLDLYKLDVGSYPDTQQGLRALVVAPSSNPNWNGPYLKDGTVPKDSWGQDFIYRSPSERENHDYDLCSNGSPGAGRSDKTQDPEKIICNP